MIKYNLMSVVDILLRMLTGYFYTTKIIQIQNFYDLHQYFNFFTIIIIKYHLYVIDFGI